MNATRPLVRSLEESAELDPELADELEQAVHEADDDGAQGRHVARETVFPRTHLAG